jgi:hypothetical protein
MDTLKIKMVIMSHISDAEMEMSFDPIMARKRMEFVKYLLIKTDDINAYLPTEKFNEFWKECNDL